MTENYNPSRYIFRRLNGRLAQFKPWENQPVSWEKQWASMSLSYFINKYSDGRLDEFEIFTKFLPRHLPVLEAGCGLGQLVVALSARGYQVKGIDYAAKTIKRIKAVAPFLDVSVGNVYALDIPAGSLGGYISLGVFEHNPEGPLAGLREVKRVLNPEGVAFISVPFLNAKRQKLLQRSSPVQNVTFESGMQFYQYYFAVDDFAVFLHQARLRVLQIYPYGVYAGLTRDFSIGRWLHSRGFIFWQFHRLVSRLARNAPKAARKRWAHMVMFICQPAD